MTGQTPHRWSCGTCSRRSGARRSDEAFEKTAKIATIAASIQAGDFGGASERAELLDLRVPADLQPTVKGPRARSRRA
jgi:hypothetical protein